MTEQQGQSPFAFAETNPVLLQLLTVNTSRGSSGWNEALCAPGYLAEQIFRSVLCAKSFRHVRLFATHGLDCSRPGSSVHGDYPGKNTEVGSLSPCQGIFPTQEMNPSLLHCKWILYQLSYQGSPGKDLPVL